MFKSIRAKLILSYMLVIFITTAVTGFLAHWRTKIALEDSLKKEAEAQAKMLADTISSLAADPDNITGEAASVADRFIGDPDKSLKVYSSKGILIADSKEPVLGRLMPEPDVVSRLFPPDRTKQGEKTFWTSPAYGGKKTLHLSYPLETGVYDNDLSLIHI